MKEAAVTDQSIIRAAEQGKLRRQTAPLPCENFFQAVYDRRTWIRLTRKVKPATSNRLPADLLVDLIR